MRLVPLEGESLTMPTAVYYFAEGPHDVDGPPRAFGRAALAAYVEGHDGRLMRSMKSILGSDLLERHTDVGGGRSAKYADVVVGYLKRLKRTAEACQGGQTLTHAVLGRPVYFVDGDPARDAQAQAALEAAARAVGFSELAFQFEPIAAAFDYEQQVTREQTVLVADIGGGTSDFSVVRVGPERRALLDRRADILAHHGIHIAGTDFDRRIALAGPMRALGHGSFGPARAEGPPREVPTGITFDLATWHLINTCYTPAVVAEMRLRKTDYADPAEHRRLMTVLEDRLGHHLASESEDGKIDLSGSDGRLDPLDTHDFDLDLVEPGLAWPMRRQDAQTALADDVAAIAAAAQETVRVAGLRTVDALYFTGGSTGLRPLVEAIAQPFGTAQRVQGDPLASVAQGLGLHARRVFG
ncbi:Hsp70 family protein [Inhella sp. 4Y17]|uniref:Hsp70 family protein n=2 Tax=Inhella gelatinilytica TaxID=2795030 RepID=A0A931NE61_9BURK|nr:Hsp70 family protein [Inhella gelatinilytica]